jgi:hypothetical protein
MCISNCIKKNHCMQNEIENNKITTNVFTF